MVTYKEFEIIKYLMLFSGNTTGAFLAFLDHNLHYPVFTSPKEVLTLIALLQSKGYLKDLEVTALGRKELEPYRVKNAFILAADSPDGPSGSVYSMPQGLYRRNGETLIERQIRQLKEAGIPDIHVVVGKKKELYFFLEDTCNVTLDVNSNPQKSSLCSIFAVVDQLDNSYICSCDHYFASNPFFSYEYSAFHATAHLDDAAQALMIRKNESGRITRIYNGGKGGSGECLFGHAYFDRAFSTRMRRYMKNQIRDFRIDTLLWEEFVARHRDNLDLYARPYHTDFVYAYNTIQNLQNIDGLFQEDASAHIIQKLCQELDCQVKDIRNLTLLSEYRPDLCFTFEVNSSRYLFRCPCQDNALLSREGEARAQLLAAESGIDSTNVSFDDDGCRLSRLVESPTSLEAYYGKDLNFMEDLARVIRQLHDAGRNITDWEEYLINPISEVDRLMRKASRRKGDLLNRFQPDQASFAVLFQFTEQDGVEKTLCHNNICAETCLMTENGINLTDWTFAGFNDPACDFAQILSCYAFDDPQVDAILEAYFGRPATEPERLHWIAYMGIHSWYRFSLALYLDSIDSDTGTEMLHFYRNAKAVLNYALPRYEAYYAAH